MLKLDTSEMHLLVLICMNPSHPDIVSLINGLSDDAKALAILLLRKARRRDVPQMPDVSEEKLKDIEAAAKLFAEIADARREEHDTRLRRRTLAVAGY